MRRVWPHDSMSMGEAQGIARGTINKPMLATYKVLLAIYTASGEVDDMRHTRSV